MPFCQKGYRELLLKFRDIGYQVSTYGEADRNSRHLILRHDIDFSVTAALPIAEIEAELGWSSHFFLLLRSDFYNVLSEGNLAVISNILSLGHSIGLHLDCKPYGDSLDEIEKGAARELAIFESAIDNPVEVISFHRPSEALLGLDRKIAGRLHTYMPRFFEDMGYCSDSEGRWRYSKPLVHEAVKNGTALQLLTHPVWWPAREMEDPTSRLEEFVTDKQHALREDLAKNCKSYKPI